MLPPILQPLARQRRADEYFQCVFLRGAQKARASAHVKTGQALDPTLFKQFEPAADRVVVQQQRSSDFLTAPTVVQKHQGVCASVTREATDPSRANAISLLRSSPL